MFSYNSYSTYLLLSDKYIHRHTHTHAELAGEASVVFPCTVRVVLGRVRRFFVNKMKSKLSGKGKIHFVFLLLFSIPILDSSNYFMQSPQNPSSLPIS